jgi:CSLREA domain-containing protein
MGFALNGLVTTALLVGPTAAARSAPSRGVKALSSPRADATVLGTITDLGPESQNGKLLEPIAVNSSQEVAFYGGAVWKRGTITYAQAPGSDPSATFTALAINDSGVVVGYTSTGRPAYWNTANSSSFTEVPVSSLTVNGQAATGGMFDAIDAAGDAVGSVWNSSGGLYDGAGPSNYDNNAGLSASGSAAVPTGAPQAVSSVGGQAVYSLDGINSTYEDADASEIRPELLISRSTQAATTTNINSGEATPVSMASNGTLTGWVEAQGSATLTLRLAGGGESQLSWPSGYSGPAVSVNAGNTAVGWVVPTMGSTVEQPIIWSAGGAPVFLLTDLPDASGWSDFYPVAINDQNDIVGYGYYNNVESGFLIATKIKVPPVVTSTGDAPAADPTSGSCDTGATVADAQGQQVPECTLRAAIQTVNALNDQTAITFEIPSSGTPSVTPASALPVITAAGTVVDGTTQAGGLVTIDGSGLGAKGDCLNVAGAKVTVQGLDLINCPTGIELQAPGSDEVQQDLIGLKSDGSTAAGGVTGVQVDAGSSGNLIGGDRASLANVISAESLGVALEGSANEVQGNLLGTDRDGSGFIPDQIVVEAAAGASGNAIGAKTKSPGAAPGNVMVSGSHLSRFDYDVLLVGGSNTVDGNAIGTNADGNAVYEPKRGYAAASDILIAGPASRVQVGGGAGFGNLIAGARDSQVLIDGAGATRAHVAGNRIGAANDGDVLEAKDATGILIAGANGSVIGGAGEGNTITGQRYGIQINRDTQEIDYSVAETVDGVTTYETYALAGTDTAAKETVATVKDNVIGPLPGGSRGPKTPQEIGVLDDGGDGDRIGPRNVISWNGRGIELRQSQKVGIDGNRIGTDSGGLDALPNGIGVYLAKSDETQLGIAGEPDTISGNLLGVYLDGARTVVQAELIGPNSRGNAELRRFSGQLPARLELRGRSHGGVDLGPSAGLTLIGGVNKGDGDTIAGNPGSGVLLTGKVVLIDDHIGVGRNGHSVVPNKGDGVDILNSDLVPIVSSVIAHNDGFGIEESDGGHAANLLDTTVYDDAKGGISIRGIRAPKAPRITSAVNYGSGTKVKSEFTVPAGDTGLLQVFATPTCEAHGAGKKLIEAESDIRAGQHFNDAIDVTKTEPVGTAITATLTVGAGGQLSELLSDGLHLDDGATSEFSLCAKVAPSK